MIRRCDRCGTRLPGKKGHGFPSVTGRVVLCGLKHDDKEHPCKPGRYGSR